MCRLAGPLVIDWTLWTSTTLKWFGPRCFVEPIVVWNCRATNAALPSYWAAEAQVMRTGHAVVSFCHPVTGLLATQHWCCFCWAHTVCDMSTLGGCRSPCEQPSKHGWQNKNVSHLQLSRFTNTHWLLQKRFPTRTWRMSLVQLCPSVFVRNLFIPFPRLVSWMETE